ncbi:MAG: cytochrome c biogenesis protein CcsA [Rikenellaceae bacterium]
MKRLLSSWGVALLLLLAYSTLLAIATGVESSLGTTVANDYIYKSVWFIALQVLMVAVSVGVMIKSKLIKRKLYGVVTLHIALILILAGAVTTHIFGYEGVLHLREGQSSSHMMITDSQGMSMMSYELPFALTLDDFVLERYPGSQSPSSYESFLSVDRDGEVSEAHIYMNRVLDIAHYRIFQTSYDPDEMGSILTISYDPWGTGITYTGYFLMIAGFLMILLGRNSYFRRRVEELNSIYSRVATLLALAVLIPGVSLAAPTAIPHSVADQFSRLQVQSPTGRMEPVDTYTEQLLRKLTRSNSYEGLDSNQAILGILAFPDEWSIEPLFESSTEEIHRLLNISGESFSFIDLFNDEGIYILDAQVQEAYAKSASERNRLDKEILKIDERANILYALQMGKLFSIFPVPGGENHKWVSGGDDLTMLNGDDFNFVSKIPILLIQEINIAASTGEWDEVSEVLNMIEIYQQRRSTDILQSERQIEVEILYNRLSIFSRATFAYMTMGIVLLILALLHLSNNRKWTLWGLRGSVAVVILLFVAQSLALAARWYISGRAPWANGYESMIYVAWSSILSGLLFVRRSYLTFALATFLGGVVLLVAHLNFLDPEITPLVPVLKSYWLMLHVAVITASYALFGMSFFVSGLNLTMVAFGSHNERSQLTLKELRIISELSLTIGLALLSIGTFLGAIWANESWGRYWGWDPKETWALISMMVYALVIHSRYIPKLNTNFAFNTLTIYALGSILMTYFGVNYFLNGLHSYAGGSTPPALWGVWITYAVVSVVVAIAWQKSRANERKVL